jgi:hypothetical protein
MTKQIQDKDLQQEQDDLEALEEVADENDYGFIIGPDGELKHMFTPADFHLDPPPIVKKILKLLGIKDINMLDFDGEGTIH